MGVGELSTAGSIAEQTNERTAVKSTLNWSHSKCRPISHSSQCSMTDETNKPALNWSHSKCRPISHSSQCSMTDETNKPALNWSHSKYRPISHSSQCSITDETIAVVGAILSVGWCIYKTTLAANWKVLPM